MSQNANVHPFLLPASKAEQPLRRVLISLQLARRIGANVQSRNAAPEKSVPRTAGAWKWINDRKLSFAPAQDWPADKKFRVIFEKEFFPDHVRGS